MVTMRILIHGINYFPELTGIGKYTGEMAQWLASRGHEVRVVTAPPYYPEWKISEGYPNRWRKETGDKGQDARDNVQPSSLEPCTPSPLAVYRCPLWVPGKPSGLKRIIHLVSFAASSFPVMLAQAFWKPEIVFVVEPPLFCSMNALLVARISGAKSWLHVQDFEVDAAFDLGILPEGKIRKLVLSIESLLMKRFSRVSTISKKMMERLEEKGVDPGRRIFFPNWVDTDAISPLERGARGGGRKGYREELGISDSAVVCLYSGNMGEKQGIEIIVDAARLISGARGKLQGTIRKGQGASGEALLVTGNEECVMAFDEQGREGKAGSCDLIHEPEIVFVLCGSGGARERLHAMAGNLSSMIWLPLQPLERLNELLNMADIHLLPQRGDVADLVMPSKLTGMLASGKPVIATAKEGTEVYEVVSGCGKAVEPGNAALLAEAIIDLSRNGALRMELGKSGRAYALENLSRDMILSRMESVMMETPGF